ncbi:MAG TPA: hypothetical protein VK158_06080 [Acidobacteriota bacterium]|nr:hypothetical protein [Acidobacteriota bacterium]
MPTQETIDSDRIWINSALSVFMRDYSLQASSKYASYNKKFLPANQYIEVKLRAIHRDYTLVTDAKYYADVRLMLDKLVVMLECLCDGNPDLMSRVSHLRHMATIVDSVSSFASFRLYFKNAMNLLCVAA